MTHTSELAPAQHPARSKPRLHGLDALRGGALLLGILLHALMPFVPGSSWMVNDANPSALAQPVVFVIHVFRMALFMALAGYFGAMVLQRRGPRHYLRDRATRILLPAVVFWPVSVLSMGLLTALNSSWRNEPPAPVPEDMDLWLLFTPGILWFLWTLMECALVVVVARAILIRIVGAARLARAAATGGSWLSAPGGVLLAGLPYLAGLLIQGKLAGGIVAPMTLRPELSSLVPYLGAFVVGWLLFAHPDALSRLARHWVAHLMIAAVATAVAYLATLEMLPFPVGATMTALAGWSWTYALIGMCVRHLTRERPVIRYLADSSYWAYLLHLPILLYIEMLIADQTWPMLVKLAISLGVTGVVLLVSYHLLVRSTGLGRWLNGRKYPFRWHP